MIPLAPLCVLSFSRILTRSHLGDLQGQRRRDTNYVDPDSILGDDDDDDNEDDHNDRGFKNSLDETAFCVTTTSSNDGGSNDGRFAGLAGPISIAWKEQNFVSGGGGIMSDPVLSTSTMMAASAQYEYERLKADTRGKIRIYRYIEHKLAEELQKRKMQALFEIPSIAQSSMHGVGGEASGAFMDHHIGNPSYPGLELNTQGLLFNDPNMLMMPNHGMGGINDGCPMALDLMASGVAGHHTTPPYYPHADTHHTPAFQNLDFNLGFSNHSALGGLGFASNHGAMTPSVDLGFWSPSNPESPSSDTPF